VPEQTHDDGEWLNEEDGEENVPWNGRAMNRRASSPCVGQHRRRRSRRENNADAENGGGGEDRHSARI
jgi:hypothetical protein